MSLKIEKQSDLLSRTVKMVKDFLMEEIWHDENYAELAISWNTTYQHVQNLLSSSHPITHDLLQLCVFGELDFGIVIRDPATGKEVTFFAAENLSGAPEVSCVTEEVQYYSRKEKKADPLDDGEIGLEFLPKVQSILFDAQGNVIPEKPIEIDGEYNLDEGILDGEFEEITQRDIEEFMMKCENCMDADRVSDSMLCLQCETSGVECHPPEIIAQIDHLNYHKARLPKIAVKKEKDS